MVEGGVRPANVASEVRFHDPPERLFGLYHTLLHALRGRIFGLAHGGFDDFRCVIPFVFCCLWMTRSRAFSYLCGSFCVVTAVFLFTGLHYSSTNMGTSSDGGGRLGDEDKVTAAPSRSAQPAILDHVASRGFGKV